jgi:hypothetical protein
LLRSSWLSPSRLLRPPHRVPPSRPVPSAPAPPTYTVAQLNLAAGPLIIDVPDTGGRKANSLPAPRGRFRMIMPLYEPRRAAFNGDWRPPPVQRR